MRTVHFRSRAVVRASLRNSGGVLRRLAGQGVSEDLHLCFLPSPSIRSRQSSSSDFEGDLDNFQELENDWSNEEMRGSGNPAKYNQLNLHHRANARSSNHVKEAGRQAAAALRGKKTAFRSSNPSFSGARPYVGTIQVSLDCSYYRVRISSARLPPRTHPI